MSSNINLNLLDEFNRTSIAAEKQKAMPFGNKKYQT
jgi:hypothetical protein